MLHPLGIVLQKKFMEFGRLAPSALDAVDFTLPPEPAQNQAILAGKPASKPQIFTGLNMWGHPTWVGKLYPKGTRDSQLLTKYAQQYNTIELNATHYKIYPPQHIAQWRKAAPAQGFKFCPKMYKGITHDGSLLNKQVLLNGFMESITAFEDALGPVFIQLSDAFGPARQAELLSFLAALPAGAQYFLELRHPDWFKPSAVRDELLAFLQQTQIGSVITDSGGRRDVVHMQLTAPQAFVRFVGNSLHPTDFSRVDQWGLRLTQWFDQGLESLYFFVHMHNEDLSPELTKYVAKTLATTCPVPVLQPSFVEVQGSLF